MNTFWPWLQRKSWTTMKNYKKYQKMQKHWHFWPWLQRKSWKIMKITKNDKNIDIFDHDCNENHEKLWKSPKMTKTLTFLNIIATKIMKSWSSWWIWRLRLCQNRDLFMPDLPKYVLRADFVKIMDLLAGEGSNLDEIVVEQIIWNIIFFCLAKRGDTKLWKISKNH